jgi:hypothetical protein
VTYGTRNRPADGNAGMIVTGPPTGARPVRPAPDYDPHPRLRHRAGRACAYADGPDPGGASGAATGGFGNRANQGHVFAQSLCRQSYQRPHTLTALAYSRATVERTLAMSLAKKVLASQHRATMSPQVSNTNMARRLARRQARAFPTGLISGARSAEAASGGWCRPSSGPWHHAIRHRRARERPARPRR